MAFVTMTPEQAKASGRIDQAKAEATTEADIRRHMIEGGFDPDKPFEGLREIASVATIRKRTGLSQGAFAKAIGVPSATLRNWEQGRTPPDPAARSLLALVADDPERAFKVLGASPDNSRHGG